MKAIRVHPFIYDLTEKANGILLLPCWHDKDDFNITETKINILLTFHSCLP
jgi:hypothetical protein